MIVDTAGADAPETDALLRLRGLGKDFGEKTALGSLTCEVRAGEVVGLLGPNGAGKTTTMRLLLGLLRPTRGAATFEGLDCTRDALAVKQRIGYSPDEPSFYDFLSGRETIEFVLRVRAMDVEAGWQRALDLARELDVEDALASATGSYSHGMKKKLALLLALLHGPRLLLLDEPTNGLDPSTAVRVRELLRKEAQAGAAIVISTHHLDLADRMCDRILVLRSGVLIAEGPPALLRERARVEAGAPLEAAFLELVREVEPRP